MDKTETEVLASQVTENEENQATEVIQINIPSTETQEIAEELTIQMKFFELQSIKCFISTKLRILNIGNLDLKTFEYLCNSICSYKFNTTSCLEELSIGLSSLVTEFSLDIKNLLCKLFNIKIKGLTHLTLLTNLDLSGKNEYSNLEKLSKSKKIEKDEELEMIELNLKKRFLRNSIKNRKAITFRDLTPSISIGKYINNNSSKSMNKTKTFIKGKNLKLSLNNSRTSGKKGTYTLNELNEFTNKLGIINKSGRDEYIKEKEKEKLLKKEFHTPFKQKHHKKITLFTSTSKLNKKG